MRHSRLISHPTKMQRSVIIIPARYASTRLPRKMLLAATGKPLIQHVYEAAIQAKLSEKCIIACDHSEIFAAAESFGANVVMTDPNAASGTDRIAEVARKLDDDVDIIVNVQGDEPEILPEVIDNVIQLLHNNAQAVMSTVCAPLRNKEDLHDPACVKVVFDKNGFASYFSRSVIPHPRSWSDDLLTQNPPLFYQHAGIYGYRRDFLLRFTELSPSPTEKIESLEQLRALYHGYSILVGTMDRATRGIDTPEDYEKFCAKYKRI